MLNRMSHAEGQRFGISEQHTSSYVKITDGKQNLSPPADKADWFKLFGVPLPNGSEDGLEKGDVVATIEKWSPPDPFDGITLEDTNNVIRAFGTASEVGVAYRVDPQSEDYAGHAIGDLLGIDTHSDEGKARVKHILATWVKNGLLEKFEGKDRQRKARPCYRPKAQS